MSRLLAIEPAGHMPSRDDGAGVAPAVDLWAMAAELERQFAGYKQRLADRSGAAPLDDDDDARDGCDSSAGAEEEGGGGGGDAKGRLYEAYTWRRDERLRDGWRERMERKEAEAKAFWAQLERVGGRAAGAGGERGAPDDGGAGPATSDVDGTVGEQKAEDGGEKRRSSDVVAPGRISGKKHARTRSFSSSTTKTSRPDVVTPTRRALSQEPPQNAGRKDIHRAMLRPTGAGVTAPKRKSFSGHRISAKDGKAGPKPPRSLPRRSSSGGLEYLREAVLPATFVVPAPVQSCSSEQAAVHDETQEASPPTPFAGAANARAASPDSDCSEVVDNIADDREAEAKNIGERNADEVITVSPGKLGNGEITSDSDTESRYVYVKKVVEEDAMTMRSETPAGSDAKPELEDEKKNCAAAAAEENTSLSEAVAAESSTTIAEEAPARESSDESSFSGRSVGSPPNSPPSSRSSRARSIERLLEEDAAVLRKKREESAAQTTTPSTPAKVSGTARSPREAVRGFKRFLSFGKKNRGREAVTVIDCTSPSVPSLLDDDGASGGWQSSTDTIKPRMASSDTASDDMDHGYAASARACSLQSLVAASPAKSELNEKSPKAHRSFFSFRSLNCGRS